ncbi:MAG: S1 family peptidase [Planctomycetota bacterium]
MQSLEAELVVAELERRGELQVLDRSSWQAAQPGIATQLDQLAESAVGQPMIQQQPATTGEVLQRIPTRTLLHQLTEDVRVRPAGFRRTSPVTRISLEPSTPEPLKRNLLATCLIVAENMVTWREPEKHWVLALDPMNLCPGDSDPSGAFALQPHVKDWQRSGTGVVVRPTSVATALHVVQNLVGPNVQRLVCIIGFQTRANSHVFTSDQVRRVKSIEASATAASRLDWAILELEAAFPGLVPALVSATPSTPASSDVYMLGYPFGTSLAMSSGGRGYFKDGVLWHSLSSFTGYSGGGIFDAKSHALVAIHRGGTICVDYGKGDCRIILLVNPKDEFGEYGTAATEIVTGDPKQDR